MATVIVHPDAELTACGIASRLLAFLVERQCVSSPVHICATGGSLGQAVWPEVASHRLARAVSWPDIHVWFSDERFVPAGADDRNDRAVRAVADRLGLPGANVHSAPGPDTVPDVAQSARAYAEELASWSVPAHSGEGQGLPVPEFAVNLLGIGPDGHVASLFPDRAATLPAGTATLPVTDSPKPPSQRVSFTRPVLSACDELWMIAAGAPKALAVGRALGGDDPVRTPAARLNGRLRTLWLIDSDLAAALA